MQYPEKEMALRNRALTPEQRQQAESRRNYKAYCRQMESDYGGTGIHPATYEQWVSFNEAMDVV